MAARKIPVHRTGADRCEKCTQLSLPSCTHPAVDPEKPARRGGVLVIPTLKFTDLFVGMKVTVLRDLDALSASFRRSPAPFLHPMRRYLGKGGTVLKKTCDKMCQVEFGDGTTYWYPAAALKAADQSGGIKHPLHEHGLSSMVEVDGEW
jgi:hypothetical protein